MGLRLGSGDRGVGCDPGTEVHWYIGALLENEVLQVLRPLASPPPAVPACGWRGWLDRGKRLGGDIEGGLVCACA
jgi:hypothetical protein